MGMGLWLCCVWQCWYGSMEAAGAGLLPLSPRPAAELRLRPPPPQPDLLATTPPIITLGMQQQSSMSRKVTPATKLLFYMKKKTMNYVCS